MPRLEAWPGICAGGPVALLNVTEDQREKMAKIHKSRNQIDALLTKEQQQQFRSFGPWWLPQGYKQ